MKANLCDSQHPDGWHPSSEIASTNLREQELTEHVLAGLGKVKGVRIPVPMKSSERISVFSFVVENRKLLEIAASLERMGVAVRAGDLASLPALKRFCVTAAVRASCYIYTPTEDIERLIVGKQQLGSF